MIMKEALIFLTKSTQVIFIVEVLRYYGDNYVRKLKSRRLMNF